jgi:internalin A
LKNNQISNISSLTGMSSITFLDLNENQISDISDVSGLTTLTDLRVSNNQISNISAVSGLTNLKYLYMSHNQLTDISDVSALTNLKSLGFRNNQVSNISALSGLTELNTVNLQYNQISDISSLAGKTKLRAMYLNDNQISSIETSTFTGLTGLHYLYLNSNLLSSIETGAFSGAANLEYLFLEKNAGLGALNLEGAVFSLLSRFNIRETGITSVSLKNAVLKQSVLEALSDGGYSTYFIGIGELGGITELDMSGVDFASITDLAPLHAMDDVEELLLAGASNLDGGQVLTLTAELDSLNWLDVTGPWDTFDAGTQDSLNSWDSIEGNTLVTPEPATMSLLALGGLAVLRRRRKQ